MKDLVVEIKEPLYFTSGYKHKVEKDLTIYLPWLRTYDINLDHIRLTPNGFLTAKRGWGWDGASGPTWDTQSSHRGSCFHDVMCYLMRKSYIDIGYKDHADQMAYQLWTMDSKKGWRWLLIPRYKLWKFALNTVGKTGSRPKDMREIRKAP